MKALIRNEGETVTEDMGIPCIDWNTGYPLTNAKWFGGPYTLVQNYVPHQVDNEPTQCEKVVVEPEQVEVEEEVIENEDDYVIIDGKKYSKEELRSLLE